MKQGVPSSTFYKERRERIKEVTIKDLETFKDGYVYALYYFGEGEHVRKKVIETIMPFYDDERIERNLITLLPQQTCSDRTKAIEALNDNSNLNVPCIEKCTCMQCKKLNGYYSIYSIDSKGRKITNSVWIDKTKAIEHLKKLHNKGHFDCRLTEGKLSCDHRVSNKDIDYVIERVINKTYLFAPPCGTREGRRYRNSYPSLYDTEKQRCRSSSAHSQSQRRTLAPCQRCGHGIHYVYLDRVYERMVKRGIIERYPVVDNNGYMNI
ncbi:hypothetical protein ABH17_026960 (plasmid) [Bacillus toyonensis]|uniref:hypothetical protein n=1 Tax=Bacillus toyonensis TaxID=155322 RepID=UPI0006AA46F1|nr:hypothetical protein [Bacillus toyonensis]OKO50961.1 hypothetical protein ABH17_026960 [Bacillus toyonensis]